MNFEIFYPSFVTSGLDWGLRLGLDNLVSYRQLSFTINGSIMIHDNQLNLNYNHKHTDYCALAWFIIFHDKIGKCFWCCRQQRSNLSSVAGMQFDDFRKLHWWSPRRHTVKTHSSKNVYQKMEIVDMKGNSWNVRLTIFFDTYTFGLVLKVDFMFICLNESYCDSLFSLFIWLPI